MTDAELLALVKSGLGITGDFQDATLTVYVHECKAFLKDAGVKSSVIDSAAAVGCIVRGVADLWNYGSGDGKLSDYFQQRAVQLSLN